MHLDEEGAFATRQVIVGTDTAENTVGYAYLSLGGRDKAACLGH